MRFTDIVPKGIFLSTRAEDAISLLTADHEKVQSLFVRFQAVKDAKDGDGVEEKQRIVAAACAELTRHTALEEELFYPAVRAAIDGAEQGAELLNEAQVEHDGAKALIEQLGRMKPDDEMFNAKFTVLCEYVKHHIKEEQWEIFPKVRLAKIDLVELGGRMAARKEELAKSESAPATEGPASERASARAPAKRQRAVAGRKAVKAVKASRRKAVKASAQRKPVSAAHRKSPARRHPASAKT